MTAASIHPFDVDKLEKGSWIPPSECEIAVGVATSDRMYSLKLLRICDLIERQWLDRRGEIVTTRSERNGIRICTDDEAVSTNDSRKRQHVRGIERVLKRQSGVDRGKLSSDEMRRRHERSLVSVGAFLAGGKREQQRAMRAHTRSTPKMIGK